MLYQGGGVYAVTVCFAHIVRQRGPSRRSQHGFRVRCTVSGGVVDNLSGVFIPYRVFLNPGHALHKVRLHDLLYGQLGDVFVLGNQRSNIAVFGAKLIHSLVHCEVTLICAADAIKHIIALFPVGQGNIELVVFAATGERNVGPGAVG